MRFKSTIVLALTVIGIVLKSSNSHNFELRLHEWNGDEPEESIKYVDRVHDMSKQTNNGSICRIPAINEFPSDFLTLEQKRKGGIIIHILIVLYLFCAIAVVCDEYFVQSLHRICDGS